MTVTEIHPVLRRTLNDLGVGGAPQSEKKKMLRFGDRDELLFVFTATEENSQLRKAGVFPNSAVLAKHTRRRGWPLWVPKAPGLTLAVEH